MRANLHFKKRKEKRRTEQKERKKKRKRGREWRAGWEWSNILPKSSHAMENGPNPPSGTVVEQWGNTDTCYGSRQTLTSLSDSIFCLMRIARARFLSDTEHGPMVTSESVVRQCLNDLTCRTTVPERPYTHGDVKVVCNALTLLNIWGALHWDISRKSWKPSLQ